MTLRAFPVIYAHDVQPMVDFYEELGFSISFRLPEEGEARLHVTMGRDEAELAIVDAEWPARQTSLEMGTRARASRCSSTWTTWTDRRGAASYGTPWTPRSRPALARGHGDRAS